MSSPQSDNQAAVAAQGAGLIARMREKIASQQSEVDSLQRELSEYRRREKVASIVQTMEEKGFSPELSRDEKIAMVSRHGDLTQIETALGLAGGGRFTLASVNDAAGAKVAGSSAEAEASYLAMLAANAPR